MVNPSAEWKIIAHFVSYRCQFSFAFYSIFYELIMKSVRLACLTNDFQTTLAIYNQKHYASSQYKYSYNTDYLISLSYQKDSTVPNEEYKSMWGRCIHKVLNNSRRSRVTIGQLLLCCGLRKTSEQYLSYIAKLCSPTKGALSKWEKMWKN